MYLYQPEGLISAPPAPNTLEEAIRTQRIYYAMCTKSDEFHNLHLDLGTVHGIIPREEATLDTGQAKEITVLSRVGKPTCFKVLGIDGQGNAICSRRAAQQEARDYLLRTLVQGDILQAVVQNPVALGAFCDIGCGFIARMRIDRCCISRLRSTSELFAPGQVIYAAVMSVDPEQCLVELTGRELLGTWEENAVRFRAGQVVVGTVRSRMPYGIFIELTPNLSGLAEAEQPLSPGDPVSVYIRSIQPLRHKVKLTVLERLPVPPERPTPVWFKTSGRLQRWEYYPGSTSFTVF